MLNDSAKQRVKDLCDQIANEQDHGRFSLLISELNQILEQSGTRIRTDGEASGPDGLSARTPS